MKKIISLILALSLFAGVLYGCGDTSEQVSTTKAEESLMSETTVVLEETLDTTAETTEATTEPTTEPTAGASGDLTLEQCQSRDRSFFAVLYPDGSLDEYEDGWPLTWEGPMPMTYGTDYTPRHLLISVFNDEVNKDNLRNGQLVLFSSETNRTRSGIIAVNYSGCTMTRRNEDGKKEAVFLTEYEGGLYFDQWVAGKTNFNSDFDCDTINDMSTGDFLDTLTVGENYYISLPEYEKYSLGVVQGTALVATEYWSDARYYFQDDDESYNLKLTPTVGGYAIVDLSELPPGDYIVYFSYWDSGRYVVTTHIVVE